MCEIVIVLDRHFLEALYYILDRVVNLANKIDFDPFRICDYFAMKIIVAVDN
jgi:hypothetical protein